MTPVLVPPHSYPVLFLDTGCQMYRRGADKPDVQCGQRKTYCKGTFCCCTFRDILSLFFFFPLSIPPTGRDRLEDSADRRQNAAFAASKSHGSRLFMSQRGLGLH